MSRLERWERRTRLPLLVLALLFAAAYAAPILCPHADPRLARAAMWAEWAVWGCYTVDYAVRLALVEHRWAFVRSQPLALAAVLLPLLQPLRLLRLLATLLLAGQRARATPQVRLTTYVVGSVLALLLFGSLAVLEVERQSPRANIRTMGDALWWAFTTMTTVGYGEHYPTTGVGRLIAVCLMLSGIALLGVVTANIAAWFIAEFQEEEQETRRQQQTLESLVAEVQALREQVALLTPGALWDGHAPAAERLGRLPVAADRPPAWERPPDPPARPGAAGHGPAAGGARSAGRGGSGTPVRSSDGRPGP